MQCIAKSKIHLKVSDDGAAPLFDVFAKFFLVELVASMKILRNYYTLNRITYRYGGRD